MNIFQKFSQVLKRHAGRGRTRGGMSGRLRAKALASFADTGAADAFGDGEGREYIEPFRLHAWVNIAVALLIRNVARAEFTIVRDGEAVTSGPVFTLFRDVNPRMSRFDLWKETAAWWFLEGEAFWWFGPDYGGGIPRELYVLDPRRVRSDAGADGSRRRWFYQGEGELIPLPADEVVHFRDWNPWNPERGVNPLLALGMEIEQDYYANRANSHLLKHNAIPYGVLKTDQMIRPEEADQIERRWEQKYGSSAGNRKVAVLGKGTVFQPLSFTPEVVQLFELKRWNVYTILAKFGIPPRVANLSDKGSTLSGQDTKEQHAAFWKYTLVPLLKQFEQIAETNFFARLGLRERGVFNLSQIPELQESADEQSRRDIAEINAGLKTINDVLKERGKDPKAWGDTWYQTGTLTPVDKGKKDA